MDGVEDRDASLEKPRCSRRWRLAMAMALLSRRRRLGARRRALGLRQSSHSGGDGREPRLGVRFQRLRPARSACDSHTQAKVMCLRVCVCVRVSVLGRFIQRKEEQCF